MEPIKVKNWYEYLRNHPKFSGCLIDNNNNDDIAWYKDGKWHRDDGPAVSVNNSHHWYLMGAKHRNDGPAVVRSNGHKEWFWYDKQCTEEQYKIKLRKQNITKVLNRIKSA